MIVEINDKKLSVALFEPRIPQNTGNIARTCAAFNLPLHLIKPFGFSLDNKRLKRAGLDYWPLMDISIYDDFNSFFTNLQSPNRIIAFSKSASLPLDSLDIISGDILLFGREDDGLPRYVKDKCNNEIFIPMPGGVKSEGAIGVRSLNLSSSVAIASYYAGQKLGLI